MCTWKNVAGLVAASAAVSACAAVMVTNLPLPVEDREAQIVNGLDAIRAAVPDAPVPYFRAAGGGDRQQTLAALARCLPWLADQGYEFDLPA
ncbi:MAG: hypothetical protein ACRDSK_21530 [Actinophytocola sp.]|uniref:hypothetical protein n=1 Tax=Actinophytocola sp. TaxID=1872138 RepID=UPI003D6BC164